jgi:hypothetical protein
VSIVNDFIFVNKDIMARLIKLLKVPEILCKQSAKSALGLLEELKSSDEIPTHMLQNPTSQQALVLIRNSFFLFFLLQTFLQVHCV